MSDKIKSGKEVIDDFFSEILNIPDLHEETVQKLITLYATGKLTETNLQNALDIIIEEELNLMEKEDEY
jgi:hypothetical protein